MADNLDITGAGDRKRINVEQVHEVRYWTQTLGVGVGQLRGAVEAVGPMADDVAKHLGKKTKP